MLLLHMEFWPMLYFIPAFATTLWLGAYMSSSLLIKAAHRFDIGFHWFNSKMDIEKKPLSAIGLVSGVLLAFGVWGFGLMAWARS